MALKYFAFDTETSGLDPARGARILSLAYILLDDQLVELGRGQRFFFPKDDAEVDPGAAAVNGYTREKWASRNALPYSEVGSTVHQIWDDHNVRDVLPLGHNVEFDLKFLTKCVDPARMKRALGYHKVDTLTLAVALDQAHGLSGRYKLATLCERYEVPLINAHDSLGDIEATVALYRALVSKIRGGSPLPEAKKPSFLTKVGDDFTFTNGKNRGRHIHDSMIDRGYVQWALNNVNDLLPEERAALQRVLENRPQ